MSSRNHDVQLSEISGKLDTLIRLSALSLVKDMKTQKEQIAALHDAGFKPREIAGVLRANGHSVNVTLSVIRKERAADESEEVGDAKSSGAAITETKAEVRENAEQT